MATPNHLIDIITLFDLICFLFVYIPTCLTTNLPTYFFTYLPTPTHLPTYHLHDVNVCQCIWYTNYEGIAINELTTILIIFDLLMSINGNLKCGYCTFNQLLWPTHKYCIFWWLLLKVKIVENLIKKYNIHIWKQCHFKYHTPQ